MGDWPVFMGQPMGATGSQAGVAPSSVPSGLSAIIASGVSGLYAVATVRKRTYRARLDRHRSLTLSGAIKLHERATQSELDDLDTEPRPVYRSDCIDGERPCPWASCKHNLYIEVTERGSVRLPFGALGIDEIPDTCALDVADRGGATLEETGGFANLTKERVRQMETRAFALLKKAGVSPSMLDPKMSDWLEFE